MTTTNTNERTGTDYTTTWAGALVDALSLFRGNTACATCNGGNHACRTCGGAGVEMPMGDLTGTITTQADYAAVALEQAIGAVADVVARVTAAVEKHAAGTACNDGVADETRRHLERLAAIAPDLCRVLDIVNELADANEQTDAADPRTLAREQGRALENAIETRRTLRVMAFRSLDALVADARHGVSVIEFSQDAYAAFYAAREALTVDGDAAFREALATKCGENPDVRALLATTAEIAG
jgi:hypothetical protein